MAKIIGAKKVMTFKEINFDGLIGPTHNYGGLSEGNVASQKNIDQVSNPKMAALQGLQKMELLLDEGLHQGIFLPHERPYLKILKDLGYSGSGTEIINDVSKSNKLLLKNIYSASSMWAANTATFSSKLDSLDNKNHLTPANLNSMFHRSIEKDFVTNQLNDIFGQIASIHQPRPSIGAFGDEGAANHLRVSSSHSKEGFQVFVHGGSAFEYDKLVKRQALEISSSISKSHKLDETKVFFLQQNQEAISEGSFHNDIVSLANENVFIAHEKAFENKADLNELIGILKANVNNFSYLEIPDALINLKDLVSSYLLNSQLVTKSDNQMMIIFPSEVQEYSNCGSWIDSLTENSPIDSIKYVDIRQSMMNGGGPACLRFRATFEENEISKINSSYLMDHHKIQSIKDLVGKHYRDKLHPDDLADPSLMEESYLFLDELTALLNLGSIYSFQKT